MMSFFLLAFLFILALFGIDYEKALGTLLMGVMFVIAAVIVWALISVLAS